MANRSTRCETRREVAIVVSGSDERGRPWVRVAGGYQGNHRLRGWVLREFISCGER